AGALEALRHLACVSADGLDAGAADPARYGVLQGAVAQGRLVSRDVSARRLVRDTRGLVRPGPIARRLRADRVQGVWHPEARRTGARVRAPSFAGGQASAHRIPEDAMRSSAATAFAFGNSRGSGRPLGRPQPYFLERSA